MKFNSRLIIFTVLLVAVTTACKFFFASNLALSGITPMFAIGIFAGMLINDKSRSFLLPLISVFAADVIIEMLYQSKVFAFPGLYKYQFLNYAILLGTTAIGWWLKGRNVTTVAIGAIASPTLFFLVSNFGSWIIDYGNLYSNDFNGLMNCYAAGLPFYAKYVASTVFFLPVMIVTYNYMMKKNAAVTMA